MNDLEITWIIYLLLTITYYDLSITYRGVGGVGASYHPEDQAAS